MGRINRQLDEILDYLPGDLSDKLQVPVDDRAMLAIGYRDADAPVNAFPVSRAPLEEAIPREGWQ